MEGDIQIPVRALTLNERQALGLGRRRKANATEQGDAGPLMAWWQKTYLSNRRDLFTRRLRTDALDRGVAKRLLAASAGSVPLSAVLAAGQEEAAAWIEAFEQIMEFAGGVPAGDAPLTFHVGLRPFARWALERLERLIESVEAAGSLHIDRAAISACFQAQLLDRLTLLAMQVFVVRLHGWRLSGRLSGATAQERFTSWVLQELADPERLRALFAEYPVLARLLTSATRNALAAWSEVIERLAADWQEVSGALGVAPDDVLCDVQAGMGDTHRGGRTVMTLRFGAGVKLVYKPRPLGVDQHMQQMIEAVNAFAAASGDGNVATAEWRDLRTIAVVDRRDYGWMEYVPAAPLGGAAEAHDFYFRQGALIGLLYLLDATDVHAENLIAAGADPVVIDLETLFQALPARAAADLNAHRIEAMQQLVLRTLLLPVRIPGARGSVDMGGMSDLAGQRSSTNVAAWQDANTDAMRLTFNQARFSGEANVPVLDGRRLRAYDFLPDIERGFTHIYRLLERHRDQLLAPEGPLAAFRSDQVRHVPRHSIEYALLLEGGAHPGCLRDAAERDMLFDSLWLETAQHPRLSELIAGERADLWRGDVPSFSVSVDSRHLRDNHGAVINDYFAASGWERVMSRLANWGEQDLTRQLYCIRNSILSSAGATPAAQEPDHQHRDVACAAMSTPPAALMDAAVAIGERLLDLAITVDGRAYWPGIVLLEREGATCAVMDPTLEDGSAGIALFLATLGRQTGRSEFARAARAAWSGVAPALQAHGLVEKTGAFDGLAGLLYVALRLSDLWADPSVLDDALPAVQTLARLAESDYQFDLYSGAAGALLVLLRVAERRPQSRALAAAQAYGRRLLQAAVETSTGLAWPQRTGEASPKLQPLLGMAHGTAGIAWALTELAEALARGGRHRQARPFARAAAQALNHEHAHFDREQGNWPDLRGVTMDVEEAQTFMTAWCHGAPGVGLARLMCAPGLQNSQRRTGWESAQIAGLGIPDERGRRELCAAVETTLRQGFGGAQGLCHGDLGNSELLLQAGKALDRPELLAEAQRRGGAALGQAQRRGYWRCTAWDATEHTGLMNGIAGIGYQLLRLAAPSDVPSVLTLGV